MVAPSRVRSLLLTERGHCQPIVRPWVKANDELCGGDLSSAFERYSCLAQGEGPDNVTPVATCIAQQ